MSDRRADAAELTVPGKAYGVGRQNYLSMIGGIRPMLLDDQMKRNDPGGSQYLIETLAQDGWNGLLRFHEGEVWRLRNRPGDQLRARARAMRPQSCIPMRRRTPGVGTASR